MRAAVHATINDELDDVGEDTAVVGRWHIHVQRPRIRIFDIVSGREAWSVDLPKAGYKYPAHGSPFTSIEQPFFSAGPAALIILRRDDPHFQILCLDLEAQRIRWLRRWEWPQDTRLKASFGENPMVAFEDGFAHPVINLFRTLKGRGRVRHDHRVAAVNPIDGSVVWERSGDDWGVGYRSADRLYRRGDRLISADRVTGEPSDLGQIPGFEPVKVAKALPSRGSDESGDEDPYALVPHDAARTDVAVVTATGVGKDLVVMGGFSLSTNDAEQHSSQHFHWGGRKTHRLAFEGAHDGTLALVINDKYTTLLTSSLGRRWQTLTPPYVYHVRAEGSGPVLVGTSGQGGYLYVLDRANGGVTAKHVPRKGEHGIHGIWDSDIPGHLVIGFGWRLALLQSARSHLQVFDDVGRVVYRGGFQNFVVLRTVQRYAGERGREFVVRVD